MKSGKSLTELAKEVERISEAKRDFVVPTEKLHAEVLEGEKPEIGLSFENGQKHSFSLNSWSSGQVSTYTDIPKAYFDRLGSENPKLLADNINHGLEKISSSARAARKPESRMVRTLDGHVRGLLSSRYRILDAHDMLDATLPVMLENQLKIVSSEITEQRLFIKALSPKLVTEVKKGDVVQYGLVVSTSDVGAGSVRVEGLIWRLACLNGLITSNAIRKFHVGKNVAELEIQELLTDKTKQLTDAAFWAQVRDVVIGSLQKDNFEKEVDKLRVAANEEIKNFDLPRVVELTMKATGITGEAKKNSIVAALASGNEGAGLTKWGLVNSITRAAQSDDFTYEESIDMERAAGQVLELPQNQWRTIAAVG